MGKRKSKHSRAGSKVDSDAPSSVDQISSDCHASAATAVSQAEADEREWTRRKNLARVSGPMENSYTTVDDEDGNDVLLVQGYFTPEGEAHNMAMWLPNSKGSTVESGAQTKLLKLADSRRGEIARQVFYVDFLEHSATVRSAAHDYLLSCYECREHRDCPHQTYRRDMAKVLPESTFKGYTHLSDLVRDTPVFEKYKERLHFWSGAAGDPDNSQSNLMERLRMSASKSLARRCVKASFVNAISEEWTECLVNNYSAIFDRLHQLDSQRLATSEDVEAASASGSADHNSTRVLVRSVGQKRFFDMMRPNARPLDLEILDRTAGPGPNISQVIPWLITKITDQEPVTMKGITKSVTISHPSGRPCVLLTADPNLRASYVHGSKIYVLYASNTTSATSKKTPKQCSWASEHLGSAEWRLSLAKKLALEYPEWHDKDAAVIRNIRREDLKSKHALGLSKAIASSACNLLRERMNEACPDRQRAQDPVYLYYRPEYHDRVEHGGEVLTDVPFEDMSGLAWEFGTLGL